MFLTVVYDAKSRKQFSFVLLLVRLTINIVLTHPEHDYKANTTIVFTVQELLFCCVGNNIVIRIVENHLFSWKLLWKRKYMVEAFIKTFLYEKIFTV